MRICYEMGVETLAFLITWWPAVALSGIALILFLLVVFSR